MYLFFENMFFIPKLMTSLRKELYTVDNPKNFLFHNLLSGYFSSGRFFAYSEKAK